MQSYSPNDLDFMGGNTYILPFDLDVKDEEIVDTDLENLLPQYLTALKDKNNFLYKEVFDYFKANNVSLNYQTDYNIFYNALNAIIESKGEQNKYSEKMKKYIVRQCKKQFLEKNNRKWWKCL